jgi:SulP family sulfate permease
MSQDRSVPTAPTAMQRWFPIGSWLKDYNWRGSAGADLIAAVSVAALLVPESMGYASVAGVPAEIGLYAAPLALVMYAMFGGSKLMAFAAAGSVAAVSASVVGGLSGGDKDQAVALTAALALTSGAVFVVAGLAKLGWLIDTHLRHPTLRAENPGGAGGRRHFVGDRRRF